MGSREVRSNADGFSTTRGRRLDESVLEEPCSSKQLPVIFGAVLDSVSRGPIHFSLWLQPSARKAQPLGDASIYVLVSYPL